MEVLSQILVLVAPFVVLALLSLRYAGESRPVFNGKPDRDDGRPNLPPFRKQ